MSKQLDQSETKVSMGTAHGKDAMFMYEEVGTATVNGEEIELLCGLNGAPMIRSKTTGRTMIFGWSEMIDYAIRKAKIVEVQS